jgi:pimeloyl-ACP methyl ester carboxylesterase
MSAIKRFYVGSSAGQLHGRSIPADGNNEHPPLLCLHPAPSSGLYFTTVMPKLNAARRVIAPDYPGYGGSDPLPDLPSIADYARAMQELIENYPLDAPVDILGFHTGCLVAAEMALMRPEQVRRLVLCDVPYFTGEAQVRLREQMATPLPIGDELECLAGAWAFNITSRVGNVPLPRAFELLTEHLRTGARDYVGFTAAFGYDCEQRFAALDADVVVIATQSGMLEPTLAAAAVIRGATLVTASEITTAVFESGADAISKHILTALDETHE